MNNPGVLTLQEAWLHNLRPVIRTRKPDCVFNVWADGTAMESVIARMYSAEWVRLNVNKQSDKPWRITHRIRVFMKDKR